MEHKDEKGKPRLDINIITATEHSRWLFFVNMFELFFLIGVSYDWFIFSPISRTELISVTCLRSAGSKSGNHALSLYFGITVSDLPFV